MKIFNYQVVNLRLLHLSREDKINKKFTDIVKRI